MPIESQAGWVALVSAIEAPRLEQVALAFDGIAAVAEKGELADRADSAAQLPCRHDTFAHFVAIDAEGKMRLDVLDRVVAGVGVERIYRVHAVHAVASAVCSLEDFHMNPVLPLLQT